MKIHKYSSPNFDRNRMFYKPRHDKIYQKACASRSLCCQHEATRTLVQKKGLHILLTSSYFNAQATIRGSLTVPLGKIKSQDSCKTVHMHNLTLACTYALNPLFACFSSSSLVNDSFFVVFFSCI